MCACVAMDICVCVRGGRVSVADCEKCCCLLQKPCAAASDRRQRVSSDLVWTDGDGYGTRQKESVKGGCPVVFMCFIE